MTHPYLVGGGLELGKKCRRKDKEREFPTTIKGKLIGGVWISRMEKRELGASTTLAVLHYFPKTIGCNVALVSVFVFFFFQFDF